MAPHIRSHRAPCSCFPEKVSLQLSSEQSIADVMITQLDWKRVPRARSRGCKSSVAITTECSRHHASRNVSWPQRVPSAVGHETAVSQVERRLANQACHFELDAVSLTHSTACHLTWLLPCLCYHCTVMPGDCWLCMLTVRCSFMWQMCSYIPTTLPRSDPEQRVSVMAAKLSASFILETLIHSKEKVTITRQTRQNCLVLANCSDFARRSWDSIHTAWHDTDSTVCRVCRRCELGIK